MKKAVLIGLMALSSMVGAQDSINLDERAFLYMVLKNAPNVKAEYLQNDLARMNVLNAQAAFQPNLRSGYSMKQFNDQLYYSRSLSELYVQTPLALKLSGGYQRTDGQYLNPESRLPANGLRYIAFELPLGAGLLTDGNRTGIKLARLERSATELEVLLEINKILFDAGKRYWKWYESTVLRNLANEAREVTEDRLNFVKLKQRIGEYAAIDTLEAFINLQSRESFYNEQMINWQFRIRELSTALGVEGELQLTPLADPEYGPVILDTGWDANLVSSHPVMRLFELTKNSNSAKERLAREYLKPRLNATYVLQQDAMDIFPGSIDLDQDHMVGLKLEYPIFVRSERAKARQWEIKNEITAFEQAYFRIDLANAIRANTLIRTTLDSNQLLWQSAASNFARLLEAEQKRFFLGESNNFLLNQREIQWLEARKKYISSYVELRIRILEYYYLLALLPEMVGTAM